MQQRQPFAEAWSLLPALESSRRPSLTGSLSRSLRAAVDSLRAGKLRSALTVAGIVVGIAALLLVLNLGTISQEYVNNEWAHSGANLVQAGMNVAPGTSKADAFAHSKLTVEDAQALGRLPHVVASSPGVSGVFEAAGTQPQQLNRPVYGGYPSVQTLQNLSVASGRFFTEEDETSASTVAVLFPRAARYLYPGVDPVGRDLRIGSVTFTVIGVLSPATGVSNDPMGDGIYVPYSTFEQRLSRLQPQLILLQADQRTNVDAVIQEATQLLDQRHKTIAGQPRDFWVWYNDASTDPAAQQLDITRLVMAFVAGIALLVGGFGIGSSMFLAVRQRTREIGVRVAVGARPGDVTREFLAEAAVLTLLGAAAGIVLGSLATLGFFMSYRGAMPGGLRDAVLAHLLPSPIAVGIALCASAVIGLVFGYLPARRAGRMDPIQALRNG